MKGAWTARFTRALLALVVLTQLLLVAVFVGIFSDPPPPTSPPPASASEGISVTRRAPVVCHPEVCEGLCDESCGQTPKIIRECRDEACHAEHPQLIYKAELSYPAFTMKMPSFVDPALERLFLNIGAVRKTYQVEHGRCPSPEAREGENRCGLIGDFNNSRELVFTHRRYVYGELAIVRNGVWRGRPSNDFKAFQCWEKSDYRWIITNDSSSSTSTKGTNKMLFPAGRTFKKLLLMLTPVTGGAYFQHFIDRGWSKLIQAWDLLAADPEVKILVSPVFKKHASVARLWARFGLADRLVYADPRGGPVHAEEMIFPCVATHYHPIVYERAQRFLGVDPLVPLDRRKTIVYLTRKGKSRQVTNEADVLSALRQWLQANRRTEKLVVFDSADWPDFDELVRFFNEEVVAVVGPHGGAFYNALFCARQTLVIELFPITRKGDAYRWPECIWWPAHFLGLRYYQVPVTGKGAGEINVEPKWITDILQHELS